MVDQLSDQLRRYGGALEEHLLGDGVVTSSAPRWYRDRRVLAAAAVVLMAGAGVALFVPTDDDERPTDVQSTDGRHPVLAPPETTAPTVTADPSSTTSTTVGLAPAVRGTATWTGGPDQRGLLRVAACPVDDGPGCPGIRTTNVTESGTFVLALPSGSGQWRVGAYVVASGAACIFNCEWRQTVLGPTTVVAADEPGQGLQLTVRARVLEVHVVDRNGNPFRGAALMVEDAQCPDDRCEGSDRATMFYSAPGDDGVIRVVVDPGVLYEFTGYAVNTGWDSPGYSAGGQSWWMSETETLQGSEVVDGRTFRVEGAPSG
jgi:hypothetical protein